MSNRKLEKKPWNSMIYPIEKLLSNASAEISTGIETSAKRVNDSFFLNLRKSNK